MAGIDSTTRLESSEPATRSSSANDWLRLEPALEEVLGAYDDHMLGEEKLLATLDPQELARRRDELWVSVGRATGIFLNLLVRESRARSILELGTSVGYSTIWLAEAARAVGGTVLTIDMVAAKHQHARRGLARAGLLDHVVFHLGDALEYLRASTGLYDFVLLDLWKDAYIASVGALHGHLEPGAFIVADNMLEPAIVRPAAVRYQEYVRRLTQFDTLVLPIGSGLAVSRYRPRSHT